MNVNQSIDTQSVIDIIERMSALYGKRFDDQWKNVDAETLVETMTLGLAGLDEAELQCGMRRMSREAWPPTIPELRKWCQPVDPMEKLYPSDNEAWTIALNALQETISYETCDEIQAAWQIASAALPDRYAARKAFCDVYNQNVAYAKMQCRIPVWWMSYGHEPAEQRAIALQSAVAKGRLSIGFQSDVQHLTESNQSIISNDERILKLKNSLEMPKVIKAEEVVDKSKEIDDEKLRQQALLQSRIKTSTRGES